MLVEFLYIQHKNGDNKERKRPFFPQVDIALCNLRNTLNHVPPDGPPLEVVQTYLPKNRPPSVAIGFVFGGEGQVELPTLVASVNEK